MMDHSPETKIAILEAKVEHMTGHVKELTQRVRANEKVVAAIGLLGSIALAFIGAGYFAAPADAFEVERQQPYPGMLPDNSNTINNWMGKMKQWELEQTLKDPEFDINSALAEYFNNGGTDTTEQEELLQFPGNGDQQSIGWRYD